MPQGEILGLRWRDVALDGATPQIKIRHALQSIDGRLQLVDTKTERSKRDIDLSGPALTIMRRHLAGLAALSLPDAYVFATSTGNPLSGRNVTRSFKAALRRAGLPTATRFHDLRQSYGSLSLSLETGTDIVTISHTMGHSSRGVTESVYLHSSQDSRRLAELPLRRSSPLSEQPFAPNFPIDLIAIGNYSGL
jgi:integrase